MEYCLKTHNSFTNIATKFKDVSLHMKDKNGKIITLKMNKMLLASSCQYFEQLFEQRNFTSFVDICMFGIKFEVMELLCELLEKQKITIQNIYNQDFKDALLNLGIEVELQKVEPFSNSLTQTTINIDHNKTTLISQPTTLLKQPHNIPQQQQNKPSEKNQQKHPSQPQQQQLHLPSPPQQQQLNLPSPPQQEHSNLQSTPPQVSQYDDVKSDKTRKIIITKHKLPSDVQSYKKAKINMSDDQITQTTENSMLKEDLKKINCQKINEQDSIKYKCNNCDEKFESLLLATKHSDNHINTITEFQDIKNKLYGFNESLRKIKKELKKIDESSDNEADNIKAKVLKELKDILMKLEVIEEGQLNYNLCYKRSTMIKYCQNTLDNLEK